MTSTIARSRSLASAGSAPASITGATLARTLRSFARSTT
jgi:hypothetical protein